MDRLLRALFHLTYRKAEACLGTSCRPPSPPMGPRPATRRLDPRLLERLSREPEARLSSRGIPEVCAFSSRFTGPFSP
jgi:hypothetical protein